MFRFLSPTLLILPCKDYTLPHRATGACRRGPHPQGRQRGRCALDLHARKQLQLSRPPEEPARLALPSCYTSGLWDTYLHQRQTCRYQRSGWKSSHGQLSRQTH